MLNLQRPLLFIDLETTGLDKDNDRIVSIAMHKVHSFGPPVSGSAFARLINPGRPIPEAATEVHNISDADVANSPHFGEIADDIYAFVEGCDVAGYNSNWFDVPVLHKEFMREGINWRVAEMNMLDVANIFKIQEPRTLTAALQFYCGKAHTTAHTAEGDVLATIEVLMGQLERYPDLPRDVAQLAIFSSHGNKPADVSGKFYYDNANVIRFNFGPHKHKPALDHIEYLEWMLYKKEFAADTNVVLAQLLDIPRTGSWSDDN